jgi:hypothetical protein
MAALACVEKQVHRRMCTRPPRHMVGIRVDTGGATLYVGSLEGTAMDGHRVDMIVKAVVGIGSRRTRWGADLATGFARGGIGRHPASRVSLKSDRTVASPSH